MSGPLSDDERDRILTLYSVERSSNTGTANIIVALVGLSLAYYVATIAYAFGTDSILIEYGWLAYLVPLLPAAMFSWILLFAMLENLRREYLLFLEERIWPAGHAMSTSAFVRAEGALWTPRAGSVWAVMLTALSVVLYGVLYASYAGYVVLVGVFVAKYQGGWKVLYLAPYMLHLVTGLLIFGYSVLFPNGFARMLRIPGMRSRWL